MLSHAMVGEERAQRIESLVARLLEPLVANSSPELYRKRGPDDWSVVMILAHLAEALPYWARQAQIVAARDQDGQPFGRTHDDPDRIAAVEARADETLARVLPRVHASLTAATAVLRALPAAGWTRTGHHARRGEMTTLQIVDQFLVEHTEEHMRQVEAALDALGRRPKEGAL